MSRGSTGKSVVAKAGRLVGGGVSAASMDGQSARMIVIEHGADFALRFHPPAEGTNTIILIQQADELPETLLERVCRHCSNLCASDVCLTRAAMVLGSHDHREAWGLRLGLAEELARFLAVTSSPELTFIARGEILRPFRDELVALIGALTRRCGGTVTIRAHFESDRNTSSQSGLRQAAVVAVGAGVSSSDSSSLVRRVTRS